MHSFGALSRTYLILVGKSALSATKASKDQKYYSVHHNKSKIKALGVRLNRANKLVEHDSSQQTKASECSALVGTKGPDFPPKRGTRYEYLLKPKGYMYGKTR
jgi:hypothetical protein